LIGLASAARTLLFVPGNRPDRFAKAVATGADLVVLDLEDAVPTDLKQQSLGHVSDYLRGGARVAVRVNAVGTPWHAEDVEAVAGLAPVVMLPKATPGPALDSLTAAGTDIIALIETAAGVLDAREIASHPGVRRLAFGALDLAAELGVDPLDHDALHVVRCSLVLASAANGLPGPVDGVWATVDDDAGLQAETARAKRLGFTGKLCIHPRQVPTVHQGFAASAQEMAWATRVLAAVEERSDGVTVVDGVMVDRPVLARARRIRAQAPDGG
jgi:citrate lyase subunit beta / citryl-CoA lyase